MRASTFARDDFLEWIAGATFSPYQLLGLSVVVQVEQEQEEQVHENKLKILLMLLKMHFRIFQYRKLRLTAIQYSWHDLLHAMIANCCASTKL